METEIKSDVLTPAEVESKQRIDRCTDFVREFLRLIGEYSDRVPMGDSSSAEYEQKRSEIMENQMYRPIAEKALSLNIRVNDFAFIKGLINQVTDEMVRITERTLDRKLEMANDYLWGKECEKITYNDVENVHNIIKNKLAELDAKKGE